ncbi:MAG: Do family serine endopeptidase [Candidatus Sericytochromatia bacterium]|nr:Do family serine endopeptidase [Candidatus Sericytochromatia bacterium]
MQNKYIITGLTLFTTGFSSVVASSLILGKPNSYNAMAIETSKSVPVTERVMNATSKTTVADKLSNDFIFVAKNLTPTIVTIYSTKTFREKMQQPNMFDDPSLREFFGNRKKPLQAPDDDDTSEQSIGSGVIVDAKGLIMTNNHVVEGATDIKVTLSDRRKYTAKVVGTDPQTDVAIIRIQNAKDLPTASFGNSDNLSVGEWVLAIGNPLGLSSTVTSGIISAKGRDHVGITDFEDFLQTDAAINPGNSGGALVNLKGEVIGINTAIASRTGGYMGIGFAIPSNMAKKVMNDLLTKGKVIRGYLGIQIQNLTEALAKSLKINESSRGIIVGDIIQGSPADKSGLQKYDLITELNGKEVDDITVFRNTIASIDPGQTVKINLTRNGKNIVVEPRIAELKNNNTGDKLTN